MKTKKHLILLILKILESETDSTHPLTQKAIVESISKVYNCDRKTVGRNIKFLTEIGYPIVKTGKGFYLENKIFSLQEIKYVVEAISFAPEVEAIDKKELSDKVSHNLSKLIKRR